MSEPFSHELLGNLVDVDCSLCGYVFEAQVVDVVTQVFRLCPCCHVRIHFVEDGSLSNALKSVDRSVQQLEGMFK